jgi:hypothetical protein
MRDYAKYAGCLREYLATKGIEIKNNKCRCLDPAHEDKNPSCLVGKNVFHCLACGIKGDIYDAVQLLEEAPLIDREKQFDFLKNFFFGYYECAVCGGMFEKGRTDEEAMNEQKMVFPGVPLCDCELVCDDCFKKVMP